MLERDRRIYLDHAATTPVRAEVMEAMSPFFSERFGNPSSIHSFGRDALQALEEAHAIVSQVLHCAEGEVVFTSGGTESNNLAIRGAAFANRDRGNHIITSSIEHHATLHTCEQLEKYFGFHVTYVPVDSYGMVDPDDVARAITERTTLISIMYANNEVGTIEPIAEIGKMARERGVIFHTDAVQGGGMLNLNVDELNVDLLSLSAHKFYGPKGAGVLYVREGVNLLSVQTGGPQEDNRRAGTENVAGIVGTATALRLAEMDRETNNAHMLQERDRLIHGVLERIPDSFLTGHARRRLPNHASFVLPGIPGPEELLLLLDREGIAASSGSACTASSLTPSHVLRAMGLPEDVAAMSLRLTLGPENTATEIDYVLDVLANLVFQLRRGMAEAFADE